MSGKGRPPVEGNGHKAKRPSAGPPPIAPGTMLFPPAWFALGRGFLVAGSSPVVFLLSMVTPFGLWITLLAGGIRFFPAGYLALALAPAPVNGIFLTFLGGVFGGTSQLALLVSLVALPVRAGLWAVVVGMLDEALEFRRVSLVGPLRGLRVYPSFLLYELLGLSVLVILSMMGTLGGGVLGLAAIAGQVAALMFLTPMPVAALRLHLPPREAFLRATRGVRLPGWPRYALIAALYVLVVTTAPLLLIPDRGVVTTNPSIASWGYVLVATYCNLGFLGAFIEAWKAVEPYVPAQLPGPARRTGRG